MKPLVLVEATADGIRRDTLGLLSHLALAGCAPSAIVLRDIDDDTAAELARHGAVKVVIATGAEATPANAAAVAATLMASGFADALFASTTAFSSEMAAAVAATADAGLWWDLVDLTLTNGDLTGWRDRDQGRQRVAAHWIGRRAVGLVRPGSFDPAPLPDTLSEPAIERVTLEAMGNSWRVVDVRTQASGGADLASAHTIVAAGRGIGRAENLALVESLARTLGAAVGVSLPLVDQGWAGRERQVGQTGTVVRPRLYVACGISGQIQHRIGIEQSGTIVAINKDAGAPIMRFCDLGIVGDVERVLPLIDAALDHSRAAAAASPAAD